MAETGPAALRRSTANRTRAAACARRLARANQRLRAALDEVEHERRRNARLDALMPVGHLALDAAGVIVDANPAAARMLGYERCALLGTPFARGVAVWDRPTFFRHLAGVVSGGLRRRCQVTVTGAPGAPSFAALIESVATMDALGRTLCLTAVTDVSELMGPGRQGTEHLRREQELRRELEAMRQRFERLAAVAATLVQPRGLDQTIACAAEVGVPELASFAAIDLVDELGHVRRRATAGGNGALPALPLDPYAPSGRRRRRARPGHGDRHREGEAVAHLRAVHAPRPVVGPRRRRPRRQCAEAGFDDDTLRDLLGAA